MKQASRSRGDEINFPASFWARPQKLQMRGAFLVDALVEAR
jgi:hypothetical protein